MNIHVVHPGETLWMISQAHNGNIKQVIAANKITNPNRLVIGQSLIIPETTRYHTIRSGETLWGIAQQYRVTLESIVDVNHIENPSLIYTGQLLIIPSDFHIVKAGETLWSISVKYGVPIQEIIRLNRIADPSQIFPGRHLYIPEKTRPLVEVNAYNTRFDEIGQQEVKDIHRYLTYMSPFSYTVKADGTIKNIFDTDLLDAAIINHIAPLMVLTNRENEFSPDLAHTILSETDIQNQMLDQIVGIMEQKGYTGLNIDFEYLYPDDKENYNVFLRRIVNHLHPLGYSVSTAVAPKYFSGQKGILYEAHDYAAHGEIVDFVIIMTYEWGWSGGPPMAVAPINEVRKVLQYALAEMPNKKIMMGMPLYGYDWTLPYVKGGAWAKTISPEEAVARAGQYGANIQFDKTAQSPFYRYYDQQKKEHIVWFEDARSVQTKYNLVKELNLRGVSYWVLGNPFPQNWPVLFDNFRIQKF